MTYGYMRNYEDRVRRAVNTPDRLGRFALWQGGMEPNIPVGSEAGRRQRHEASGRRRRARTARGRQRQVGRPLEDGPHRPAGLGAGRRRTTSSDARSRRSPTRDADADGLTRSSRRRAPIAARAICSASALQYGNAFGQGLQAAALKPADFFGNDDVLYLMEDMATGEIRLSILWEWLHKGASLTADDEIGVKAGDRSRGAVRAAARRGIREAAARRQPRRPRRLEGHDAADRARDRRRPTCSSRPSCRGTSTCSTSTSTTTISRKPGGASARWRMRSARDGTRVTENLDFEKTVGRTSRSALVTPGLRGPAYGVGAPCAGIKSFRSSLFTSSMIFA